jgi:carotenoid biosynthesis protein
VPRRVDLKHIPVRAPNPFSGWQHKVHVGLTTLFLAAAALAWLNLWISNRFLGTGHWPDGLLILSAAATSMAALCRQLPAQNVIFASFLIGLCAGGITAINGLAGVPFGPLEYQKDNVGEFILGPLPWAIPVLWVVILLNARGVGRLILRSQRHAPNYGFRVMGLTVLLVVIFQLSLQPYATELKEYWIWKPTKLPSSWYTTPWTNFLGCGVMSLLILLFVTPMLISKSPVPRPPAYHPLLMWELLNLQLLSGTFRQHLWGVSALTCGQMVAVAVLTWVGNRGRAR